jgi:hypothetical protein
MEQTKKLRLRQPGLTLKVILEEAGIPQLLPERAE